MLVCGAIVGLPRVVVPKVGAASVGDPSVPVVTPGVPVAIPNGVVPGSAPENDNVAVGAAMKAGTVGAVEPVTAAGVLDTVEPVVRVDVLDPALGVPIKEPTLAALLVPMTAPAGPLEGLFAPGSVDVVAADAVTVAGAGPGY